MSERCTHPLGFTVLRTEQMCCFDCGEATPGRCYCGALYRTPTCQNNGHIRGPRIAEYWDWGVCYARNGAGYFDGGDMRDDETCHTCSGRGGAQVWREGR